MLHPRRGLLACLFLAEILLLSWLFDFGVLAEAEPWWARSLWYAPRLIQIVLVCGAAFVLLAGPSLAKLTPPPGPWAWRYLLGHGLTVAGFAFATDRFLRSAANDAGLSEGWLLAWLGLGAAAGFLSLACWSPPSQWCRLVRYRRRTVLAAGAAGLSAWIVGWLLTRSWESLGHSTMWSAAVLLRLFSPVVVYRPDEQLLGTPAFVVEIAPACSGYEGMSLAALFAGLYLWLFRDLLCFPRAWLLVPLGVALAWLANVVRIAALVAVGTWLSPAVALGGFHSQAGWLAFLGLSLGLVAVSRHTGLCMKAGPVATEPGQATAAYLAPCLVLVATPVVTATFSSGFDAWYPLRIAAAGAALWYFWPTYVDLRRRLSLHAVCWGMAAFSMWLIVERFHHMLGIGNPFVESLAPLPAGLQMLWLGARVVGSVLIVPLAEELAFRGYLLRRLQAADFQSVAPGQFTVCSFLVSSLLFGVLHSRWLAGTLAGMIYALVLYRRGELADAVLAHAVTNALIAVTVLTAGCWQLWM